MKKTEQEEMLQAYTIELHEQTHPLERWYRQQKMKDEMLPEIKTEEKLKFSAEKYLLFCSQDGCLSPDAETIIQSYFTKHPQCLCLYADEDEIVIDEEPLHSSEITADQGKKQIISSDGTAVIDGKNVCNPWLKPQWSPDTFRSFFYFGNIFALRVCPELQDMNQELTRLVPVRTQERGIIRFTDEQRVEIWKCLKKYMPIWGKSADMAGHCEKILFHYDGTGSWEENLCFEQEDLERDITVSIIIPSKDHPKLLEQCLLSISASDCGIPIRETSGGKADENIRSEAEDENNIYDVNAGNTFEDVSINKNINHNEIITDRQKLSYEIIVVDNGSSEENQKEIQKLRENVHFIYIYKPMEFNFSRMCNLGVAKASGEVLLFLNDDITVQGKNWLQIMASQALCPETGVVGAKLYYPDSRKIQHAGITNMKVGPAHKFGGTEDNGNLYHMRSKAVYNVIAVTAAALAVEKVKFDRAGGFQEQLAVAYNDVELGFKLFEAGYYNVQRNDVILYHHESVSRGGDDSPEKEKRLRNERGLLYHLHPELKGRDPFYHPLLVQKRLDADYHVDVIYDYEEKISDIAKISGMKQTPPSLARKLLRKGQEMLMNIDRIYTEEDNLCIEGWGSLTDKPLPGFQRKLLLMGEKQFSISVFPKYRPDTKQVLAAQPYYELSGFVARIPKKLIPAGRYQIGMEMEPGKVMLSEAFVSV